MDAVIFDESPMASYLEGQGTGIEMDRNSDRSPSPMSDVPNFAPRGLARLRRSLLPPPLKIKTASIASRFQSQSPARSPSRRKSLSLPGHQLPGEDEQFLERFRYLIVASQLLTDQISSFHHRISRNARSELDADAYKHPPSTPFSIEGAAIAGVVPVLLVFIGQWVLRRAFTGDGNGWVAMAQILLMLAIIVAGTYVYSRRKYVKEVRHTATQSLSTLIASFIGLDTAITTALNFIQEVEIVSRGYDITNPLPPISRIEERTQQRRCLKLRRELALCLNDVCNHHIEAHHVLTRYAAEEVVEQYHDIYDVSRRDYQEVGLLSPKIMPDDQESLRGLKAAFAKQFVSRKVVLCDLLAFSTETGEPNFKKWHIAIEEMQRLNEYMSGAIRKMKDLLDADTGSAVVQARAQATAEQMQETSGPICNSPGRFSPEEGEADTNRAQISRINALSQGIRTLNAKMHLFKEQVDEATSMRSSADISAILVHQYDSAGADLRSLLAEWERGRQLMMLQSESRRGSSNRFSRSPLSPTQSLGGSTAVDGSPSDALRRLHGDDDSDKLHDQDGEGTGSDEEIFEAMSLPKQRPASNLTREEKLAKMKEDRLKRALFQEKQDANTHLLKELETVIKHRPRGRTSTRNTTL